MIWRWLTIFSAAFGIWMAPPVPVPATVSGDVELTNSHDPTVRKSRDYSGVVLKYQSSFEDQKDVFETFFLILEKDGSWRVLGYKVNE